MYESEITGWIWALCGAGAAYVTIIVGWFWRTELRRCRRCRLRGVNCYCVGGPR